jgi:hypothetical protein
LLRSTLIFLIFAQLRNCLSSPISIPVSQLGVKGQGEKWKGCVDFSSSSLLVFVIKRTVFILCRNSAITITPIFSNHLLFAPRTHSISLISRPSPMLCDPFHWIDGRIATPCLEF